ncbi:hypothetical protein GYMLUDRAFT_143467, partial [Collybiopsis luxurians FD-317 M1]
DGKTKCPRDAHIKQQLLTPVQEGTLVEWCKFLAATAHSLSKHSIAPKVKDLCGRNPKCKWVKCFLK